MIPSTPAGVRLSVPVVGQISATPPAARGQVVSDLRSGKVNDVYRHELAEILRNEGINPDTYALDGATRTSDTSSTPSHGAGTSSTPNAVSNRVGGTSTPKMKPAGIFSYHSGTIQQLTFIWLLARFQPLRRTLPSSYGRRTPTWWTSMRQTSGSTTPSAAMDPSAATGYAAPDFARPSSGVVRGLPARQ